MCCFAIGRKENSTFRQQPLNMKSRLLFILCWLITGSYIAAQENTHFTNPAILQILKGNYNPGSYLPAFPVSDPATISEGLVNLMSRIR